MNSRKKYVQETSSLDKYRLFCFPYAGGGASVFRMWQEMLEGINVYSVQYPGRENRIMEKSIFDITILVNEIYSELKGIIEECPFILFGHSLGTKVVYELTLKIYNEKKIWPKAIIVSGGKAPYLEENDPISHLDDEEFIKELVERYSSIPDEILQDKEVMNIFLPTLRADFIMSEKYTNKKMDIIGCPIMGLLGTDDLEMIFEDLDKWKILTNKGFYYKYIKGDHMFINKNRNEVIYTIKKFIKNL